MACCRHGPGSPAPSARIHPVLRRSSPRSPSRNNPAETATRSWLNKGRSRAFTSRSDDAHSSSVCSMDAPTTTTSESWWPRESERQSKRNCNAKARRQSPQCEAERAEVDECCEALIRFVVTRCDPTILLEIPEEGLDQVPTSICGEVAGDGGLGVRFGRDHGLRILQRSVTPLSLTWPNCVAGPHPFPAPRPRGRRGSGPARHRPAP